MTDLLLREAADALLYTWHCTMLIAALLSAIGQGIDGYRED